MSAEHPSGPAMVCSEAFGLLPELALGILPGDQRAVTLAHVESCPTCQAELDGLVAAADGIFSLVPAVEPAAGFEQRVLSAVGMDSVSMDRGIVTPIEGERSGLRRMVPRRVWLPAAAAVAVVAAGFGGWAIGRSPVSPARKAPVAAAGPLVEASLVAHGTTVGRVYTYWDNPGWMYMSVNDPSLSGRITCELVQANGTTVDVGWFTVTDGSGHWGTPVPFDPASVRQARLLDDQGHLIASARL